MRTEKNAHQLCHKQRKHSKGLSHTDQLVYNYAPKFSPNQYFSGGTFDASFAKLV